MSITALFTVNVSLEKRLENSISNRMDDFESASRLKSFGGK